jgi:nicotinamide riboside kinase
MKKIISISGTHGTGKSSLVYEIAYRLKVMGSNVVVLNELARECPFGINADSGDNTQIWLICKQICAELELMDKYDIVVTDRGIIDSYCYGLCLNRYGLSKFLGDYIKSHIEKYYKNLYLLDKDSFDFHIDDGVRDMDTGFRDAVHNEMLSTMNGLGLNYSLVFNKEDILCDL